MFWNSGATMSIGDQLNVKHYGEESWSNYPPTLIDPEVSLLHSQNSATVSQLNPVHALTSYFKNRITSPELFCS
jgi:hypothetical protein